jgi:hypothetical protein
MTMEGSTREVKYTKNKDVNEGKKERKEEKRRAIKNNFPFFENVGTKRRFNLSTN